MAQQFEVVCNGLNENAGQAIKTMDESASVIRSNMSKVNAQLENQLYINKKMYVSTLFTYIFLSSFFI